MAVDKEGEEKKRGLWMRAECIKVQGPNALFARRRKKKVLREKRQFCGEGGKKEEKKKKKTDSST